MLNNLLLPNKFRKVGFVLLIPALILMIAVFYYEYSIPLLSYGTPKPGSAPFDLKNFDFSDELAMLLTMFSLFCIAFSKEKHEDEYLREVRWKALQVSVYINYLVIALGTVLIYGLNYLYVLYANLFTILVIFIIVYYYRVYFKGRLSKEEQS